MLIFQGIFLFSVTGTGGAYVGHPHLNRVRNMATLRKIASFSTGDIKATVYRDAEWQEYRIRLSVAGVLRRAADAHADAKLEALATARVICAQASGQAIATILQD